MQNDNNDDDNKTNNNNNNNNNNINNNNFLNFTWFLFVNKRIYISSTLTVLLPVVGRITRDVCINLYQFKSSGFSHSLLRMQDIL